MYICDMKKLLLISITLFALTACHKDIWDKLNDHRGPNRQAGDVM